MTPDPYVWQARALQESADFVLDQRRLMIWRRVGGAVEYLSAFTEDGYAIITRAEEGTLPAFRGFCVPIDAISSLVASMEPGPSRAEIRRLEESLAIERRRVDDVLRAASGGVGETP